MSERAQERLPSPPAYAWDWLQRSRPVVVEIARRLTGGDPPPGFVDTLRERFDDDQFVRDVVADTVAEVAFRGRVPTQRPPGASWDRGLAWWAATLAGVRLADFERRGPGPPQRPLFDEGEATEHAGRSTRVPGAREVLRRGRSPERTALAAELRAVLEQAEGDQVPAAAIRDLLAALEERDDEPWP